MFIVITKQRLYTKCAKTLRKNHKLAIDYNNYTENYDKRIIVCKHLIIAF